MQHVLSCQSRLSLEYGNVHMRTPTLTNSSTHVRLLVTFGHRAPPNPVNQRLTRQIMWSMSSDTTSDEYGRVQSANACANWQRVEIARSVTVCNLQ